MAEQKILACSKLMAEQSLTIAFAGSATAGWLCSEFTLAPGSGRVFIHQTIAATAELFLDEPGCQ